MGNFIVSKTLILRNIWNLGLSSLKINKSIQGTRKSEQYFLGKQKFGSTSIAVVKVKKYFSDLGTIKSAM